MSETAAKPPVKGQQWYWATSTKATIGIEVSDGKIVEVAPYGYKWLHGKPIDAAIKLLESRGWMVRRGDGGA